MKTIRHYIAVFGLAAAFLTRFALADEPATFEFHSQRKTGQIDHANVQLEAKGDLLVRSSSGEKPERQEVSLECHRDYDEKTLQLPAAADKTLRGVRYYREATAKLHKGTADLSPSLRADRRLVGVEISGAKVTPFAPRGPLNVNELELLSAIGETLPLDQLLPDNAVKVGDSWAVSDETLALLLGLDEITANSVRTKLAEVSADVARLELEGKAKGKLYGAANRITLTAKCRFDRRMGRIDWFAMRLQQNREPSLIESGLDWTVLVQERITPRESSDELSDAALADVPLKPSESSLLVQYQLADGEVQLAHDRSWFLTNHYSDQDEFHRLDHGQDVGLCKISPQPQVSVAKLPSLTDFQGVVQKALSGNFGAVLEASESRNAAHVRILRVNVKGTDGDMPVRWFYYHVSDPEGRQVALAFRVEEKHLEAFGKADDALVQALRFVEKVEKSK